MEITSEKLIELVEEKESYRCTVIDFENENKKLREYIVALKNLLLEKCYNKYSSDGIYENDKINLLACGVTLEEIKSFISSKKAEGESC